MYCILIVDDERIEREGLSRLVRRYEPESRTLTAENGEVALRIVRDRQVDIVITDIKMPFMDGLELAEAIKSERPNIELILYSAYGEFEYARRALLAKVSNYLLKPVRIPEFTAALRQAMENCAKPRAEQAGGTDLPFAAPEAPAASEQAVLSSDNRIIAQIKRLVEERYDEDLSLDRIAASVYLTPGYLSFLFKKETGESLIGYITQVRLEKAAELLKHTNMKIAEIGGRLGYRSSNYFIQSFRRHYGITPAKFRETSS